VKGQEFIGEVKRYGRRHGVPVHIVAERGKGSHITLYLGKRFTIVKDRKKEIGKGLYHSMLKQLGIENEI
jgi:hypothetical protein